MAPKQSTNLILFLALATLVLVGFAFSQPKQLDLWHYDEWVEIRHESGSTFVVRKSAIAALFMPSQEDIDAGNISNEILLTGGNRLTWSNASLHGFIDVMEIDIDKLERARTLTADEIRRLEENRE